MTARVGQSLGEGATETERTPSEVNEAAGGTCPDYPDKHHTLSANFRRLPTHFRSYRGRRMPPNSNHGGILPCYKSVLHNLEFLAYRSNVSSRNLVLKLDVAGELFD